LVTIARPKEAGLAKASAQHDPPEHQERLALAELFHLGSVVTQLTLGLEQSLGEERTQLLQRGSLF